MASTKCRRTSLCIKAVTQTWFATFPLIVAGTIEALWWGRLSHNGDWPDDRVAATASLAIAGGISAACCGKCVAAPNEPAMNGATAAAALSAWFFLDGVRTDEMDAKSIRNSYRWEVSGASGCVVVDAI